MINLTANEVKRLYVDERLSLREVGKRLGVTGDLVWARLKDMGVPRRRFGRIGAAPWLKEEDMALREMWDAGLGSNEIGRRMGRTKNSIIGRAWRLGVPPRRQAKKPERLVGTAEFGGVTGWCQWLEGEPKERNFCGARTNAGSSWCPDHYSRVFREGAA